MPRSSAARLFTQENEISFWIVFIVAFIHLFSAVIRLAYYNVSSSEESTTGFIGLPTTEAAVVIAASFFFNWAAVLFVSILVSALMIMPIKIPRPNWMLMSLWLLVILLIIVSLGYKGFM